MKDRKPSITLVITLAYDIHNVIVSLFRAKRNQIYFMHRRVFYALYEYRISSFVGNMYST